MKRDGMDKWTHDCYCDDVSNKYHGNDTRIGDIIKFYRLYGGKVIKQMHRDLLKARLKIKIMKPTVKLMSVERGELQGQIEDLNREIKRLRKQIMEFHNRPKVGSDIILNDIDGWLESVSRGSHNKNIRAVTERIIAIVLTGVRDGEEK